MPLPVKTSSPIVIREVKGTKYYLCCRPIDTAACFNTLQAILDVPVQFWMDFLRAAAKELGSS